jgi:hypothetical protein
MKYAENKPKFVLTVKPIIVRFLIFALYIGSKPFPSRGLKTAYVTAFVKGINDQNSDI